MRVVLQRVRRGCVRVDGAAIAEIGPGAVILLGIGVGGALFGLVGTVFAVPAIAAALNGVSGYREPPSTGAFAESRGR